MRDQSTRDPDAEALEAFFAAARAADAPPRTAFLNAILADAAACATAPAPPRAERPAPRGFGWTAILGGWRGGAVLTACALAGFLIGVSSYGGMTTDQTSAQVASETALDVGEFYDLAALE